jgi:L-ascorbate metabolism protein UlaG (beta-lactamase superfamily)
MNDKGLSGTLLQPVCRGDDLIREIRETGVGSEALAVWWLGQSGYAFKWNGQVLYIDLYLSEHLTAKYANTDKPHVRMTESPLRGHELTDAALILASHKHSDHLDPGTLPGLFQASSNARLLLPKSLRGHAESLGLERDRLIPSDAGEEHVWNGIRISPLPSAHESLDWTEEGGYPYLGFLLHFGPITVYHSGDTIPYEGLAETLRDAQLDLAFLPINGRDARRKALGVPGNMTLEEAVDLCETAQPRVVIPHHYDMFTFNTADVGEFASLLRQRLPNQGYKILQCGERWVYSPQ